ncbi:hypothetical protein [Rhodococcus phage RGL3]|uniref:Uncharacterized protein n=1 Tax=Rhodococcus phage RGL3 TaxID=2922221 RepID=G9FHP9_9CAUD|nr:hypothetical protein RoPhRGL3_gp57 [Rhodococcus phage RGL3]AEV52137.1 hypothetical protein [Rhodococcus phage RGL3]
MECEWFLLCQNEARFTIDHPLMGGVMACERCRDKYLRLGGNASKVDAL